jgi:hypothetical protein
MKSRSLKFVPLILFLLCAANLAQDPSKRFQVVIDRMVDAINKQDFLRIQQDFGKVMLDVFPLSKSKPFFEALMAENGKIKRLNSPRFTYPNQAVFPAQFERNTLDIKIVLDTQDKIIGLWFLPHTPTIPVPEKHETLLSLPFKGNWMVLWGGDTKELNLHHDVPSQKYAYDFLQVDERGKTHKNEGKRNDDYFAFGREVVSPADGVVTDVIEGVLDNTPGSMNPYSALGNAVFIEHRKSEVSILAHLKQGSICVKVGEKVRQGQKLGFCGNSGNSSEPHIHYHLQNTPVIQDGTGMKCVFNRVVVNRDGKIRKEESCSPIKEDIVSNE